MNFYATESILCSIAKYRLRKLKDNHYTGDETDYQSLLSKITLNEDPTEALEYFTNELPDDLLSTLISKLNA